MIPLKNGPRAYLTRHAFAWWCRRAVARHFHATRLYGEFPTPRHPRDTLVVASTHTSFWDGIALNALLARYGWTCRRVLSDALQVRRHPFFSSVGSFGVDLADSADRARGVRYAVNLLRQPTSPTALVLFPQGRIEPAGERLSDASHARTPRLVARRSGARLAWVAVDYRYWFEQRPEMLVAVEPDAATPTPLADVWSRVTCASRTFAPGLRVGGRRRSIKDLRLLGRLPPPSDPRERRLAGL